MLDIETEMMRYAIEGKEKWREIIKDIPPLHFKPEWKVFVIPPLAGAVARFCVENEAGKRVSVYLDWYAKLGFMDKPYYELYPFEDDVKRYYLDETDELMADIEKVLG